VKRLILLRHGKSDWNSGAGTDHDRPLAARGVKASRTMGTLLAAIDQVPDKVIASSALRARTTAELAMEAGDWGGPLEISPDLYDSTPGNAVSIVHAQSDDIDSVMLVGHEPAWSTLASVLTGGSHIRMVTGCAAGIDFAVGAWDQIGPGSGSLVWLLPPRPFTGTDLAPS